MELQTTAAAEIPYIGYRIGAPHHCPVGSPGIWLQRQLIQDYRHLLQNDVIAETLIAEANTLFKT